MDFYLSKVISTKGTTGFQHLEDLSTSIKIIIKAL
jgi:hypothetical protein